MATNNKRTHRVAVDAIWGEGNVRRLQISSVEVISVRGHRIPEELGPRQGQAKLIHTYGEHGRGRDSLPAPRSDASDPELVESLYLRIGTNSDLEGLYGPIDREAACVVVNQLGGFLIGQDPLAVTIIWDKLYRIDRHSRHGHFKMGISAVDNALWDLRGKAFDAPVYQLLGGPSRPAIPAYASTLGTPLDTESIKARAVSLRDEGYAAQKWFFAHGPVDGAEGMERNIEIVEILRASVGQRMPLMFDVFMGWDLAYAREWARATQSLNVRWLEEPFSPTQYPAFVDLHRSTGVPLAAGEHLYDRGDVRRYLDDGVLAALQCDPEWCGGVTDLVRIVNVAEQYGTPVIPHGHGVRAALHVVASQSPATCPMVEYLVLSMPGRHRFELDPPVPEHGVIRLSASPGFGIEFDARKVTSRQVWRG